MNSKRSVWKVLLGVVGVGLLVTNCTIKTKTDDDCTPGHKKNCNACDNGVTGSQTCQDDGSYGECVCPGSVNAGSSNGGGSSAAGSTSSGGTSNAAGYSGSTTTSGGATTNGGASSSAAGEGGEGGEGTLNVDPTDCAGCLDKLCALEWQDCVLEDEDHPETPGHYCLSANADGSGQIEKVLDCIDAERKKGLVKRDAVRACGSSLGTSADPSFFQWPPTDMTAVTTQVLNCMADSPTELTPGTWADSSNIPTSGSPKPWLDNTCAKLACTSAQN
ncbi:MAG TPA: hypothetical protein VFK05_26875 [Polyangiaceae bacterium]|nr:hypothetical protein [Polyangiaceae bacterium]